MMRTLVRVELCARNFQPHRSMRPLKKVKRFLWRLQELYLPLECHFHVRAGQSSTDSAQDSTPNFPATRICQFSPFPLSLPMPCIGHWIRGI